MSGPLEEEWGLYITTVGCTKIDINQTYPPTEGHPENYLFNWNAGRILDDYTLIFISKGSGVFESKESDSSTTNGGDCILLFPGVWHRYKPNIESGWEEYWVGFKGSYVDWLMKKFDISEPIVSVGLNDYLLRLFHELLECVQTANVGYHQIIPGIVLQMLGLVHSVSKNRHTVATTTSHLVEEAKFLFRETIQEPDRMEDVLKKLPASYSKLRKDFKTLTGESPNQYKLNLRLNKAKELLTSTNLSISEIAFQTGFESVSYLSKIFKKKNSISPKLYRQRAINGV
jgi:AraC-like DNA-binding protein